MRYYLLVGCQCNMLYVEVSVPSLHLSIQYVIASLSLILTVL